MAIHGFSADGVRRIVATVRNAERTPINRPQKRGRYPLNTPAANKHYRITAVNCCVDAFSLALGATGEVFAASGGQTLNWVLARPCDPDGEFAFAADPEDEEPPSDSVLCGFPHSFRGFVTLGTVVLARSAGKPDLDTEITSFVHAVTGGHMDIECVVDDTESDMAVLYEGQTDAEVTVPFEILFGGSLNNSQSILLAWGFTLDDEDPTTSRLRLADFGCPPVPEE